MREFRTRELILLLAFVLFAAFAPWGPTRAVGRADAQTADSKVDPSFAPAERAAGSEKNGQAPTVATPNFFDQRQRMKRPDLGTRNRIRFLTTTDFAPFNFLDPRGRLVGFNVDLVREICKELDVLPRCQIEALPFDQVVDALKRGDGEAAVMGLAMTPITRQEFGFSEPYFRYPARFVTLKDAPLPTPVGSSIDGRTVAVTEGSAQAAMLGAFFPKARIASYKTRDEALAAVRDRSAVAYFGDGVGLSFWLESESAAGCCAFSGGPFLSDRFLGEGLAIAVQKNDTALALSIDYAIGQIVENGKFTDLLLRYFPVSAF